MQQACAGLVLAAGASSRMGQPKALLKTTDNQSLGNIQCQQLKMAGCDPVFLVVGSDAALIQKALPEQTCVVNADWTNGRVSSVQAGLMAVESLDGCILLPVDTVGIKQETLCLLRDEAQYTTATSLRPFYRGQRGHVCWLSRAIFQDVMQLNTSSEAKARLDRSKSKASTCGHPNFRAAIERIPLPIPASSILIGFSRSNRSSSCSRQKRVVK